ncbi:MAG TPA: hypothetical protein VLE49_16745 [Anaerolineales bacterium]|nr:hypothetical protein [Anaerolineales bacterium]
MRVVTAVLAIATGVIVLLGYFFPPLEPFRLILVNWAIVIAGIAVLVGIFNLAAVQIEKIRTRQKGGTYGALMIVALFFTLGLGLSFGPENQYIRALAVNAIIVPAEASLMAILAVTLIYASIRLLRRRVDVMSVVFLAVALIFLFLILPIIPGNQALLNFLGMFSRGGARGLLIGIALGTLLTGLRVLFGVDRPYGGN